MLDLEDKPEGLRMVSPRQFWNIAAGKQKRKE
jgi:hypothetical protein